MHVESTSREESRHAEIMDFRAGRNLRGRNDRPYAFAFDQNGRRRIS